MNFSLEIVQGPQLLSEQSGMLPQHLSQWPIRRDAGVENQSILFATEVGVTLDARIESGATSRQAKGRLCRRERSF